MPKLAALGLRNCKTLGRKISSILVNFRARIEKLDMVKQETPLLMLHCMQVARKVAWKMLPGARKLPSRPPSSSQPRSGKLTRRTRVQNPW